MKTGNASASMQDITDLLHEPCNVQETLTAAIVAGNPNSVRNALDGGARPRLTDLEAAVGGGQVPMVSLLLAAPAMPGELGHGATLARCRDEALHQQRNAAMTRLLAHRGAAVGTSELRATLRRKDAEMAMLCLRCGAADPTLLHLALVTGDTVAAELVRLCPPEAIFHWYDIDLALRSHCLATVDALLTRGPRDRCLFGVDYRAACLGHIASSAEFAGMAAVFARHGQPVDGDSLGRAIRGGNAAVVGAWCGANGLLAQRCMADLATVKSRFAARRPSPPTGCTVRAMLSLGQVPALVRLLGQQNPATLDARYPGLLSDALERDVDLAALVPLAPDWTHNLGNMMSDPSALRALVRARAPIEISALDEAIDLLLSAGAENALVELLSMHAALLRHDCDMATRRALSARRDALLAVEPLNRPPVPCGAS